METATQKKSLASRRVLSARWKQAAGMLRHRKAELERHVKRVRAEWRGR